MNDEQLTSTIRRLNCSIPKQGLSARFMDSDNLEFRWFTYEETLRMVIPDYLRNAPDRVIMDIARKIIQKALYDSDNRLSDDTKKWMLTGLNTPENVDTFCLRNGLTKISQYNDAIVVTSDGDVVDSSVFFRVVSVPKGILESPDYETVIEIAYQRMIENGKEFMEA